MHLSRDPLLKCLVASSLAIEISLSLAHISFPPISYMSTIYMSQLSTIPLMEGEHDHGLFPAAFRVAKDPPILFPFMITNPVHVDQLQGQSSYGDQHLRQPVLSESTQQFTDQMMISGSEALFPTRRPSPFQSIDGGDMIQRSAYDPYDIVEENKHTEGLMSSGGGWAASSLSPPAKMKIMRKKATSEYPKAGGATRKPRRRAQAHQDESQQLLMQQAMGGVVVRVCSDCSTTKTPLWRSGPCGPKSLCNACGIRQRKARRAMAAVAAAAAASNGGGAPPQAVNVVAAQQPKPAKKEKRSSDHLDRSLPFKKRCKMVVVDHAGATNDEATTTTPETAAPTKDQADHASGDKVAAAATSLESKIATPTPSMSSFHAFPADEITDAAMLLMALSCGLVHS